MPMRWRCRWREWGSSRATASASCCQCPPKSSRRLRRCGSGRLSSASPELRRAMLTVADSDPPRHHPRCVGAAGGRHPRPDIDRADHRNFAGRVFGRRGPAADRRHGFPREPAHAGGRLRSSRREIKSDDLAVMHRRHHRHAEGACSATGTSGPTSFKPSRGRTRPCLNGTERYLVVIPYFHLRVLGLHDGRSPDWTLRIIHPKCDPSSADVDSRFPSYLPAVPTLFVSLLNHPKSRLRTRQVRLFNSGGAPCPSRSWRIRRPRPAVERGYGLSETSPVTHSTPQLAFRKMGTIGLPFPDADMKIVASKWHAGLPVGQVGELCIAGPQVMKGAGTARRTCVLRPGPTAASGFTPATSRGWTRTALPPSCGRRT